MIKQIAVISCNCEVVSVELPPDERWVFTPGMCMTCLQQVDLEVRDIPDWPALLRGL